jgi:hypothetical protein
MCLCVPMAALHSISKGLGGLAMEGDDQKCISHAQVIKKSGAQTIQSVWGGMQL